ncbi:MAG: di-trans,poly-cis-decaprenylcistransferase [Candidatus Aenigmarchaeota archaeon]|nr:di-trans,poly-cis-decaprenylcistransferase [Candidatus Aenigmarchaeota archaeon]
MGDDFVRRNKSIHIGLIPDGNRRYAKKMGKPVWHGHWEGAKRVEEFLNWCQEYPQIRNVTIFALSTENLSRSKKEVEELWKIYRYQLKSFLNNPRAGMKVRIHGNDSLWSPTIKDIAKELVDSTKNYSKYMLNIMLAYGSKFEINEAIKKVVKKPISTIDRFLMVREPLDLLIRTGKQHRLSNFMLYQASYAEIYFSDSLWPEFTRKEFDGIMDWYFEQQKKFGR